MSEREKQRGTVRLWESTLVVHECSSNKRKSIPWKKWKSYHHDICMDGCEIRINNKCIEHFIACCHAKTNLHAKKKIEILREVDTLRAKCTHLCHIENECMCSVYVCVWYKCLLLYVHTNYDRKLRKFFGHCTFKHIRFVIRIPFSSVQILFRCRTMSSAQEL